MFISIAGQLGARDAALEPAPAERAILSEYEGQVAKNDQSVRSFAKIGAAKIPEDFAPWWIRGQRNTIGETNAAQSVTMDDLYVRALRHSSQIRVFSDLPLIRETGIQEAKGAFDTNAFVQGKFDHANDPVGSTLTTGGASRFIQDEWTFEAGAKKKFITGTEITVSQQLSRTDNNSIFFVPNPQSKATLALSVVQPLLKGAGIGYNRSVMQIAKLDSDIAMQEFIRQSESHLLEITRTYWALYAARVTYLQKARLVDDTARVTDELRARQKMDAGKSQLFRAESALASRRSDLVRSEAAVRNAQDRLRALTNDPELLASASSELIPRDRLVLSSAPFDAAAAARAALETRPEINQAFLQLRAATIREKMQRNELLPELNLVLQGTLGGLDEHFSDVYARQYDTGAPGYGAGIVFSIPLENNIARARLNRRRLELRQQIDQLRTTIETVLLEVKISAREVATGYRETQAKYAAVKAFTEDLETLQARRALQAIGEETLMASYLSTLLDSQDRRANAEEEFIRAAANYQIAIVNLERAKGKLLAYSDVNVVRKKDEHGLPRLYLEKGGREAK
ncbi:MAG TPA: TolC family protein [Chthoniobacteraceae bacterium]|nr:TolC family protein [Chthoniobacteraceae bacterium]